jgi:hypothetical protein
MEKRNLIVFAMLGGFLAGCASSAPKDLQEVSTEAAISVPGVASAGRVESLSANPNVAVKTFTWGEIRAGDCHQIEGTLELRSDGTATFKCVTWTDSTHSGDYWWSGLLLQDHSEVTLHNEPYHKGPRMDDGHPSPRYRWSYDFHYDASKFNDITKVRQSSKC